MNYSSARFNIITGRQFYKGDSPVLNRPGFIEPSAVKHVDNRTLMNTLKGKFEHRAKTIDQNQIDDGILPIDKMQSLIHTRKTSSNLAKMQNQDRRQYKPLSQDKSKSNYDTRTTA